jgi:hypothetical protein
MVTSLLNINFKNPRALFRRQVGVKPAAQSQMIGFGKIAGV